MKQVFFVVLAILGISLGASAADIRNLCPEDSQGEIQLEHCSQIQIQNAKLSPAEMKLIDEAIDQEINIWGDTILEGDVQTDLQDLQIEQLDTVQDTQTGSLLGYRVQFSVIGWNEEGKKGRIRQAFFVSKNLTDIEILIYPELH